LCDNFSSEYFYTQRKKLWNIINFDRNTDVSNKFYYNYYFNSYWTFCSYKGAELKMDCVYKNFLDRFSRKNQEIENQDMKFADFFKFNLKGLEYLNEKMISVTRLDNSKYFISNCKTKGFLLEKNADINKLNAVTQKYKDLQNAVGKITDLFGFTNKYFVNIVEIFSNDEASNGLGDFSTEFLERSDNRRIVGNIDIDRIFTMAYEGNGNRIILTKENFVYIYAHDLATHHYEKVKEIPKNTFFAIPKMYSLEEFVIAFFDDFMTE